MIKYMEMLDELEEKLEFLTRSGQISFDEAFFQTLEDDIDSIGELATKDEDLTDDDRNFISQYIISLLDQSSGEIK